MELDNDMTRIHREPTTSEKSVCCTRILPSVACLLLFACALYGQSTVPDLTMSSNSVPAVRLTELAEDTSQFSYAVSGLFTTRAEGIKHGFGIGFTGFFDRFQPVFPSAGVSVVVSSLRIEGLPHTDFIIFSPNLDLTLRKLGGPLRPFAGIGIDLHYCYLSLDEPADIRVVYDSTAQAKQIDMGWEFTPHAKVGLVVPMGKKLQLLLEGKFMSATHAADVSYRNRLTGEEWHGTVDYRIPSVWLSVGIVWRAVPGKHYGT